MIKVDLSSLNRVLLRDLLKLLLALDGVDAGVSCFEGWRGDCINQRAHLVEANFGGAHRCNVSIHIAYQNAAATPASCFRGHGSLVYKHIQIVQSVDGQ